MKYQELPAKEKLLFESRLLHAVRNHNTCFCMANEIIELGAKYKVFDGIKFGQDAVSNSPDLNANLRKQCNDTANGK